MNSIFEIAQISNLFLNHANSVPYKMSRIIEIYFVYSNVLWYAKVQQLLVTVEKNVSGVEKCMAVFLVHGSK